MTSRVPNTCTTVTEHLYGCSATSSLRTDKLILDANKLVHLQWCLTRITQLSSSKTSFRMMKIYNIYRVQKRLVGTNYFCQKICLRVAATNRIRCWWPGAKLLVQKYVYTNKYVYIYICKKYLSIVG